TEPGFDGGQELPQQHECGDAASDDEPAPDESIRLRAAVGVGEVTSFSMLKSAPKAASAPAWRTW
ncbi:hypothetical protein XC71_24520, partial [Klebsiella pneumoniae]|nr:hypothetical protein [Klebsiella pneumoniae]